MQEEDSQLSFPGMSLHDFMQQTRIYEHTPVAFSPLLARHTRLGMLFTLLAPFGRAALLPLSHLSTLLDLSWLGGVNNLLYADVAWMSTQNWLDYLNAGILLYGLILLILTRNFHQGRPWQHWSAFIVAVIGLTNLCLLLIPGFLMVLKVVVWLVIALTILVVLGTILRFLFARQ